MFKRFCLLLCTMSIIIASISSAHAAFDAQTTKFALSGNSIPEAGIAGSTIELSESGLWKLITVDNTVAISTLENVTKADEIDMKSSADALLREQEDALVAEIHRQTASLPIIREELPTPVVGMRVSYDAFGNVDEIYILDESCNYINNTRALAAGTRKPMGVYTYGTVVQNSVGYVENTIRISSNTSGYVLGEGDFSTFTDSTGDHGNALKRGDCATKGSIDNPRSGTVIRARNMENDEVADLIKNDNGTLQNAVLDIWKTSWLDLGITSTNYNSLKMAGRYYYEF